ncbi:hypothetical protein BDZ89DRAFT_1130722 [Hymenopellis radicata]|nr:hypothetical protein BDZ89DRAFT_1130722 [Hymenopellis radicata]
MDYLTGPSGTQWRRIVAWEGRLANIAKALPSFAHLYSLAQLLAPRLAASPGFHDPRQKRQDDAAECYQRHVPSREDFDDKCLVFRPIIFDTRGILAKRPLHPRMQGLAPSSILLALEFTHPSPRHVGRGRYIRGKRPLLMFPEEDLMPNLIDIFFSNIPNYLAVLHEPSFRREVACGLHHLNSSFGGVVLMVCGVASRASRDSRVLPDGASEPWKWVDRDPR